MEIQPMYLPGVDRFEARSFWMPGTGSKVAERTGMLRVFLSVDGFKGTQLSSMNLTFVVKAFCDLKYWNAPDAWMLALQITCENTRIISQVSKKREWEQCTKVGPLGHHHDLFPPVRGEVLTDVQHFS